MTVLSQGLIAYRDTIKNTDRSWPDKYLSLPVVIFFWMTWVSDLAWCQYSLLASIQANVRHARGSAHCQLMSAVARQRHTQGVSVWVRHLFSHSSNPELFMAESLNFDLCTFLTICQVMGQLSKAWNWSKQSEGRNTAEEFKFKMWFGSIGKETNKDSLVC